MRTFDLSVDSNYAPGRVQACADYTSRQISRLTSAALSDCLERGEFFFSNDEIFVQLPHLFWCDETMVTASDWMRGIQYFLANNILARSIFAASIQDIRTGSDVLRIKYRCQKTFLLDLLSLSNLAPYHHHSRSSGTFRIGNFSGEDLLLLPNGANSEHEFGYRIHRVKSPDQNLAMFSTGELDVTCDTAFPAEGVREYRNHPHYFSAESGLFGFFSFGPRFLARVSDEELDAVGAVIRACDFGKFDHDFWTKANNFLMPAELRSHCGECLPEYDRFDGALPGMRIQMAYDDFYPNSEICALLAVELENKLQLRCELIQDDYYSPNFNFDMRFNISYFLVNSPRIRLAVAQLMAREGKTNDMLISIVNATSDDELAALSARQEKHRSLVPRFAIKSHYLSRIGESPFLR